MMEMYHGAWAAPAFRRGAEQAADAGHAEQERDQKRSGEGGALKLALVIGAAQREALLQEEHADEDADDEADEADNGVRIAAAETEQHPQRAAEEDQRADHDGSAENEAEHGELPALPFEFPCVRRP